MNWWCKFGLHDYKKWEVINTLDVYSNLYPDDIPSDQYIVQSTECKNCGKIKYRREKI